MSIRMIVLHNADDDTELRVAAHTVHSYQATSYGTRVSGLFEVRETVDQIDAYFDIDRRPLPAHEDFESEEGVFHT